VIFAESLKSPRLWPFHLAGLWALVVAQPLLDLIARNPEFLIAHHARRAEVLGLAAVLVLLCPLLLAGAVFVSGMAGATARALAIDVLVGILIALAAMQVGRRLNPHAAVVIPIASIAGVVCAVAYQRQPIAQAFASVLAMGVIVVPVAFWLQPEIYRLLSNDPDVAVAGKSVPVASRNVPVVMMVFDEMPLVSLLDAEATIDAGLFPNLADLARDGIWFRNATTVSDYTRWALPAIVSGMRPRPEASPSARDHPRSIFSLLARTHDVSAIESVTDLCPERVCDRTEVPMQSRIETLANDLFVLYQHLVLTDDLKGHLPDVTANWADFQAPGVDGDSRPTRSNTRRRRGRRAPSPDARLEVINRFVERIERHDDTRPGLYFVHSMLSHSPYWLLPSGQIDSTRSRAAQLRLPAALPGRKRELWPRDGWAVAHVYQRQMLQFGFVDAVIGRLVARLKAAGMYERSLVILLSDHGSAFRPGSPRRDFTDETAAQIMRIPLILKLPANSPHVISGTVDLGGLHVNDRNVQTIDLVPTIADVLGIDMPWKTHGTSLVDTKAMEPATKTMFYDLARRRRDYDRNGPDLSPDLRSKLDTFGGSENPYRAPRPPRFVELLGQKTSRLRISDGGCAVNVDYLSDFSRMNRDAATVPFEFAGRFVGRLPARSLPFLAVAINGTIRAVTRGWQSAPREWLATPSLDAWRNGENAIDVLGIEQSVSGPVLRRCTVREGRSH
jgi:hypothetical protein